MSGFESRLPSLDANSMIFPDLNDEFNVNMDSIHNMNMDNNININDNNSIFCDNNNNNSYDNLSPIHMNRNRNEYSISPTISSKKSNRTKHSFETSSLSVSDQLTQNLSFNTTNNRSFNINQNNRNNIDYSNNNSFSKSNSILSILDQTTNPFYNNNNNNNNNHDKNNPPKPLSFKFELPKMTSEPNKILLPPAIIPPNNNNRSTIKPTNNYTNNFNHSTNTTTHTPINNVSFPFLSKPNKLISQPIHYALTSKVSSISINTFDNETHEVKTKIVEQENEKKRKLNEYIMKQKKLAAKKKREQLRQEGIKKFLKKPIIECPSKPPSGYQIFAKWCRKSQLTKREWDRQKELGINLEGLSASDQSIQVSSYWEKVSQKEKDVKLYVFCF